MRISLILFVAICLVTGHAIASEFGFPSPAIDRPATINAADTTQHTAVVTPTYLGSGNVGPQSYIRFFSVTGAIGTTSTFTVTVTGATSGNTYGSSFTVAIPYMASIQLSVGDLVKLAGATLGVFTGGDSAYAIFIKNSDAQSGYQHIVYDWTSNLFENMSNCGTSINEQVMSARSSLVLANLHTSKGPAATFPSTIKIYNTADTATTFVLTFYNAGANSGNGSTFSASANAGKLTCQIKDITIPANTSLDMPMSTVEGTSGCTVDSDEAYADVVVAKQGGGSTPAVLSHIVHVAAYGGNVNMTAVCAVNPLQVTTTTTTVTNTVVTSEESQIYGNFTGWSYGRTFTLLNGQVWQQTSFDISVDFLFDPNLVIWASGTGYKMSVSGDSKWVSVTRLQ